MKIFNGLRDNQAVFFNGRYVVQLPRGVFLDSSGNTLSSGQVVVEDLNIQKETKEPSRIVKYIFSDGTEKFPEDYIAVINEMEQYEDDWGEPNYPSIEVEFDIRKRLQEFQDAEKVYSEPVVRHENIDIDVIGSAEDTGSDFIETPFQHGCVTWNASTGIYKLLTTQVSLDQWRKEASENTEHAFDNAKGIGGGNKGKLEFAKIDNKYVFTHLQNKTFINRGNTAEIFSTLKAAQEREKEIRQIVSQEVAKHTNTGKPDDKTLGEIIQDVDKLNRLVREIESKQKTENKKWTALKNIGELSDRLTKQLERK